MNKKQIATVDYKLLKIELALIEQEWLQTDRERKRELHLLWMGLEIKAMEERNGR